MSAVRVQFLGTGDAFGSGGRSHACILVSAEGTSVLLDCGASALPAMKRFGVDPATIDAVAISHLHGDHFGGLPFLLMDQHFGGRTRPLTIAGPAALEERLRRAGDALFADFFASTTLVFPVLFVTLGAAETALGSMTASALPVRHVAASDPHGIRIRAGGKLIAYSGDAVWSGALIAVAAGADLFVCEATTFEPGDPVHLSYRELAAHRAELACKRIVLTHLGAQTLARLDELAMEHAADGTVLTL